MAELEITSDRSTLTIESESVVPVSGAVIQALSKDLDALDAAIHLDTLVAEKLTASPLEYRYEFTAKDARRFYQSLLFEDGVKQTFDTFGFRWIEDKEFAFHGPIRASVVTLIRDFGLERLSVEYF